jgi:hypothetical protein
VEHVSWYRIAAYWLAFLLLETALMAAWVVLDEIW